MIDRRIWRTIPGGAAVPTSTAVTYRLHNGDTLLGTPTTDATGLATYTQDGHPGPYYATMVSGGTTRVISSKTTGTSGPSNLAALPDYFSMWTSGVIDNINSELAVTSAGVSMNSTVAKGQAVVKGLLYDMVSASLPMTHATADATNPRIDTVVVRVSLPGSTDEGKADLVVRTGSPAASPVAPTLTQSGTLWEFALADVRVNAGVSVIAADKVTDRRVFAAPLNQGNTITAAMITAEGNLHTSEAGRFLRAPTAGLTPTWSLLNLGVMNDVTESTPNDGDTIIYDTGTSKFLYQSNEVPSLRAGQLFATTTANLSSVTMTNFGSTDSFVLVSGVTYDIDLIAVFGTTPQPTRMIGIRITISGTGTGGQTTGPTGGNAVPGGTSAMAYHFASVVGSGQTITVQMQGNVDSAAANNYVDQGFFRAIAIPRR